jgi:hypothetical protein
MRKELFPSEFQWIRPLPHLHMMVQNLKTLVMQTDKVILGAYLPWFPFVSHKTVLQNILQLPLLLAFKETFQT